MTGDLRCGVEEPSYIHFLMILRRQAIFAAALVLIGVTDKAAFGEPIIRGKPASQWIEQLNDVDPHTKLYAAEALGTCGAPCSAALPTLKEQLGDSTTPSFARVAIAKSIIKISPEPESDVISTLVDIIEDEWQARGSVPGPYLEALGEAGSRAESAVPLLQKLCSRWAGSVQMAAGNALWKIQGRRCH